MIFILFYIHSHYKLLNIRLFLPKNQVKQMPYRPKTAFFLISIKKSSRRRNKLAEFAGIITILYQQ